MDENPLHNIQKLEAHIWLARKNKLLNSKTMSRFQSREDMKNKVYIGNLPKNADEKEIERAFERYGTIKNVWVARNPPGFGFVEFLDPRDATDAIRGLDGR